MKKTILILMLLSLVLCLGAQQSEQIKQKKTVTACKQDVDIRGINNLIAENISLVSMDDLVDLIFENDTIINM